MGEIDVSKIDTKAGLSLPEGPDTDDSVSRLILSNIIYVLLHESQYI